MGSLTEFPLKPVIEANRIEFRYKAVQDPPLQDLPPFKTHSDTMLHGGVFNNSIIS